MDCVENEGKANGVGQRRLAESFEKEGIIG